MPHAGRVWLRATLCGGLTAGALDIADALIFHGARGVAPWRVLQAIASGLLGREAFSGGAWTATLGLGLHFLIATSAAALYALASLHLPVLVRRPWLCGSAYGLVVYAVDAVRGPAALRLPAGTAGPAGHASTGGCSTFCWRTSSASECPSP